MKRTPIEEFARDRLVEAATALVCESPRPVDLAFFHPEFAARLVDLIAANDAWQEAQVRAASAADAKRRRKGGRS